MFSFGFTPPPNHSTKHVHISSARINYFISYSFYTYTTTTTDTKLLNFTKQSFLKCGMHIFACFFTTCRIYRLFCLTNKTLSKEWKVVYCVCSLFACVFCSKQNNSGMIIFCNRNDQNEYCVVARFVTFFHFRRCAWLQTADKIVST